MNKIPPEGWRLVTEEERKSLKGLSAYLAVYPEILHRAIRYDTGHKAWMSPKPYRFFWDDQLYAVPIKESNGN